MGARFMDLAEHTLAGLVRYTGRIGLVQAESGDPTWPRRRPVGPSRGIRPRAQSRPHAGRTSGMRAGAEAWATACGGNPLVGRLLCEVTAARFNEDPYASAWA